MTPLRIQRRRTKSSGNAAADIAVVVIQATMLANDPLTRDPSTASLFAIIMTTTTAAGPGKPLMPSPLSLPACSPSRF